VLCKRERGKEIVLNFSNVGGIFALSLGMEISISFVKIVWLALLYISN
jgi:hypothetical protein